MKLPPDRERDRRDAQKAAAEAAASAAAAAPVSGPRHTDQIYRDLGLQLVTRLAGVIRIGRAYQVENQVFGAQLDTFVAVLEQVLQEANELVLVALDSDLYLNGFRIPVRPANVRFHKFVVEEFANRKIAGLKIEKGVDRGEVDKFFELFMKPDEHTGTGLLEACLTAGCDRIQPAVHASTHSPDYDFGSYGIHMPEDEAEQSRGDGQPRDNFDGAEAASSKHNVLPGRAPAGAARKSYRVAVQGTRSLLAPTSLQSEMEMRVAKRVVQPLVDGAFDKEPVVVGLATLGHHDEYTYAHAVNVTMVAVTMGHVLGLDRRALADLGCAALLHDVGKNAIADLIEHPLEEFTDEEKQAAKRHPAEGVKILARSTALNQTTLRCMRVAFEHHMVSNGRGYPFLENWKPSVLSQIVSVADAYVCLQTYRSRHGANVTPYQALGMVLGPMRSNFHPYMLWALVQTVGLYPPGQLVELDDARIAVVLAPNPADLERPSLKVVARADRHRMTPEERVDFRPLPVTMKIVRALRAEEYPEEPDDEDAAA